MARERKAAGSNCCETACAAHTPYTRFSRRIIDLMGVDEELIGLN
jgi:hypothetical protein